MTTEDITFRAVRANWPVLIAVEGISRYAADMALIKHRLDRVEVSCGSLN